MDVILINPNPSGKGLNESTILLPLGLGYIAAVLDKNGFKCGIIDANIMHLSDADIIKQIPEDTKVVCIYLNSFSYNSVRDLSKIIRVERKKSLILVGGPLPSVIPESVFREIDCDGVIKGEGEFSVLNIMNNIRDNNFPFEGEISGATFLKDDKIVSNPVRRITNLDELPFPAYHMMPPFKLYKSRSRKKPTVPIVTTRGCPFECSFCSKDIFQRRVTLRSAENVLSEIDYLVSEYGVRQIDIMDDNFAQNRKRLENILDGLIERNYDLAINLQAGIRTEILNEDILKKMKKAGVYKLAFGIESADEELLKIHSKKLSLKKVEETVKIAKKLDFVVYGFFIIGLLGETEEAFNKTLEFTKKLDIDIANFCMAIPFVGTELYRMVEEKGRFLIDTTRNIDSGFYDGRVFFEYGDYKKEDILKRYRRAYKEFYSFGRQLKIILKIRSFTELLWVLNSVRFVLKGMLKRTPDTT